MKCEICGKEFTKQMSLSVHIAKTHNKTSIICKICGKETKEIGWHIKKSHINISCKDYYDKYLKQPNDGICPICGKETTFLGITKGYRQHCCVSCSSADPNVQVKNAKTNLARHGYIQPLAQQEIHMKGVQKSLSEDSKEKRKQTNLKHCGYECNFSSKENQLKSAKTCIKKYGVNHIAKVPEIQQKGKDTQRQNHNGKLAWNTPEQREAAWQTRRQNKNLDDELENADE